MRRLILFDIDGTLVWGGPAKGAFRSALIETYGTTGDLNGVSFAGRTDPQIARDLLTRAGFTDAEVEEGFPGLWERYLAHLEVGLVDEPLTVLPGVRQLLDALAAVEGVALGLLTGNIVGGAELKLGSAGLWDHFGIGGFGSDHEERDELPAIALERARARWGSSLSAENTIIVGDTPRDIACGRVGGTRTLAVATGTFTRAELEPHRPDHLLEDLSATMEVVSLLTSRDELA